MFNLPPFYVGQKVIALTSFDAYQKGGFSTPVKDSTYTVREVVELEGKWCVRLVEVKNSIRKFVGGKVGEVGWVARHFVELDEMVLEKIEFKKGEEVFKTSDEKLICN